ncbi:Hypothetical predicted protein, partial [Pelobates cultripes]
TDLRTLQTAIDRFIWNDRKPRVRRSTLYVPKHVGGLGLPNLLYYQHAAHLAQIQHWHLPPDHKRWVDLEHLIFGRDHPSLYIWLPKQQRPLPPPTSPAITYSIDLWDRLSDKFDLSSGLSPLTPILRNRMFPPGLTPQHYAHFEDRDIARLGHLYPN